MLRGGVIGSFLRPLRGLIPQISYGSLGSSPDNSRNTSQGVLNVTHVNVDAYSVLKLNSLCSSSSS